MGILTRSRQSTRSTFSASVLFGSRCAKIWVTRGLVSNLSTGVGRISRWPQDPHPWWPRPLKPLPLSASRTYGWLKYHFWGLWVNQKGEGVCEPAIIRWVLKRTEWKHKGLWSVTLLGLESIELRSGSLGSGHQPAPNEELSPFATRNRILSTPEWSWKGP